MTAPSKLIPHLPASVADISSFAVVPQKRGCGIGKALMTHIIDYCKSHLLSIILASTAGTSLPLSKRNACSMWTVCILPA